MLLQRIANKKLVYLPVEGKEKGEATRSRAGGFLLDRNDVPAVFPSVFQRVRQILSEMDSKTPDSTLISREIEIRRSRF